MTRCEAFYDKVDKLLEEGGPKAVEEWCKKDYKTVMQIKRAREFCSNENLSSALAELSERAIRPIISLNKTNPELVPEVLEEIQELERPTARAVKTIIQEKIRPKPSPLPDGLFNVIYADPPWRYDFSETDCRAIENQYPTMELEEIKTLDIPSADDAVLFLWATAPKLREALEVMEAWGFEYKTHAIWDKEIIGMGYWFRGQHELLLIGTKGQFSPPPPKARISSVFRERRGEHSSKPEKFYEIIARMCPDGKYLELFARGHRTNWELWGNEAVGA